MEKEAWQAMPVHFIPPTVSSESCTQEAMGGKDGLEAQVSWELLQELRSNSLQQDARCCDGFPGRVCASAWMCPCVAPAQQRTRLGSDAMGLLRADRLPETSCLSQL